MRLCTKPGCHKKHVAKGLCAKHYTQNKNGRVITEKSGNKFMLAIDLVTGENPWNIKFTKAQAMKVLEMF